MLESGSCTERRSLRAWMRPLSLPDRPMPLPPARVIALTMDLLIEPASTISTTSTVSASVTRRPSMNSLLTARRSSMAPICGPPPCTTMGLMPTCFSSTTSRAKVSANSGSPMAWPPYLMTKLLPA